MDDDEHDYILSLVYKGSEYTPDAVRRYSSFEAKAHDSGFSGETEFETIAEHLEDFVRELNGLYESFSNSPVFEAGAGENFYFRLTLSKHDWQGHVALECEIRRSSIETFFDSVHVYHVVELNQVHEMAEFFQRSLTSAESETFRVRRSS